MISRKTFLFNEGMMKKISEIKEKLSYKHEVDVVVHAINNLHKEEFKDYLVGKSARMVFNNLPPEEKAKSKLELAEAMEQVKQEKADKILEEKKENGKRICTLLKGKTHTDHNKNTKCFWNSGSYINPKNASIIENEEYIEDLTEEHIQKQFYNSVKGEIVPKEVVVQALKNCGEKWKDN